MKDVIWKHPTATTLVASGLTMRQKIRIMNKLHETYDYTYVEEQNCELIFMDLSKEEKEEIIEIITLLSP